MNLSSGACMNLFSEVCMIVGKSSMEECFAFYYRIDNSHCQIFQGNNL